MFPEFERRERSLDRLVSLARILDTFEDPIFIGSRHPVQILPTQSLQQFVVAGFQGVPILDVTPLKSVRQPHQCGIGDRDVESTFRAEGFPRKTLRRYLHRTL